MLHKLHNMPVNQFREDVKNLQLRFPVAMISEGTGYDKSTVSRYLKGEQPSEAFLKAFYEWVEKSGNKVSLNNNSATSYDGTTARVIELLESHLHTLKQENALLHKVIQANLNEMRQNQKAMLALLTDMILRNARYRWDGDKKRLDIELEEINKIVSDALK